MGFDDPWLFNVRSCSLENISPRKEEEPHWSIIVWGDGGIQTELQDIYRKIVL